MVHRKQPCRKAQFLCAAACASLAAALGYGPSAAALQGLPVPVLENKHFGWDQQAPSATELAQYRYALYVDGVARVLTDADCQAGSDSTRFICTASLPSMFPGKHRLELATIFETGGSQIASAKSAALTVLTAATPGVGTLAMDRGKTVIASDEARFVVTTLASGLDSPSSLAALPDGRVFIAERSGEVLVWQNDHVLSIPALSLDDAVAGTDVGLLGIAVHPNFSQDHFVYIAYTARDDGGRLANVVVRYRELNNILAQAAVIFQDPVGQAPHRTPRIKFGPDNKLYVAFPSADTAASRDPSSYVGKILRLNEDGSTPRDNPRPSPIVHDKGGALAFGWQPASGQLWEIDRDRNGADRLRRLDSLSSLSSGGSFDAGTDPTAAVFYGGAAIRGFSGNLFVAALDGQHIQRLQFDPSDFTRVVASERLFDGQYGRISDIVTGPDGGLYFSTSNRTTTQPAGNDDRLLAVRPISRERLP